MQGVVRPPGSKSLTQRYLTCAALADGTSRLSGALIADDSRRLAHGLSCLGIRTELVADDDAFVVHGRGGIIPEHEADLDAGAAGTAMRFLTALACVGHGQYRVDGSGRMRQRPIGALVDGLRSLGAEIGYELEPGFPPVTVAAHGLSGGQVDFERPPSSQFVSAVLMVAPYALNDVMIAVHGGLVSGPYVGLTLRVMQDMGVEALDSGGRRFVVPGSQRYRSGHYQIEPDASSASYFLAAAAVTGGSIRVEGLALDSPQGDVRFARLLEEMGCRVAEEEESLSLRAPSSRLRGIVAKMRDIPDVVQTLAAVALFADGPTEIHDVANLRIKETDRLTALANELRRLGARVDERADGLTIHPPARVAPARIETYDDHRMAMAMAVVGLAAEGIQVRDGRCVSKSYPRYFDDLDRLHAD